MGTSKGKSEKKKKGKEADKINSPDVSDLVSRLEQLKNLNLKAPGIKKHISDLKKVQKEDEKKGNKLRKKIEEELDSINDGWLKKRVDIKKCWPIPSCG